MTLLLLSALMACIPDPAETGVGAGAGGSPAQDVPHTEVPHVNRGPAGDGKPDPNAPVSPPPGVDPPPSGGSQPTDPQPADPQAAMAPAAEGAPGGDPSVPPPVEVRVPTGYQLITDPDPGWSALPAARKVTLSGAVDTMDRGQVRLSVRDGKEWKILDYAVVNGGRFSIEVPKDLATPIYLSATSDATGDGPSDDDPTGALKDPVVVKGAPVQVTITLNDFPLWTKDLPVDVRALVTRGTVEP